jgi:Ca-activated chloride channel homolog
MKDLSLLVRILGLGSFALACTTYARPDPIRGKEGPRPPEAQPQAAEGHRFEPRSSPPRRIARIPEPQVGSMPAFHDGSAQCFPSYEAERRFQPYGYGYGGGGRGSAAPQAQGFGLGSGRLGGSHKSKGAARSSSPATSAATQPAPAPPAKAAEAARSEAADSAAPAALAPSQPAYRRRDIAPPEPARGQSVFLSNDDSMSLSSAQRVIWAIDRYEPIRPDEVRPHELLNYFSFGVRQPEPGRTFSVAAHGMLSPQDDKLLQLGLAIHGREVAPPYRKPAELSFVLDRSGSMDAEGRMEYVKRGLLQSLGQLQRGDLVHIVLFDDQACTLAQNFVVGRDSLGHLERLIRRIEPTSSTNLHAGLNQGYGLLTQTPDPNRNRRVVLITDALANQGVTDPSLLAIVSRYHDRAQIRLSGVGVGSEFNDQLLDELTEAGKGAYLYLGNESEVDAVFGRRFASLIETVAHDVHFRLTLPPSLRMRTFYGEEASEQRERVQSVHYFAGTTQMLLSDLELTGPSLNMNDEILLSIDYEDPDAGQPQVEEFALRLGDFYGPSADLAKAHLLMGFAREVERVAARGLPGGALPQRGGYRDDMARSECVGSLADEHAHTLVASRDPEVSRIRNLWTNLCARYAPPERSASREELPGRHNDFAPQPSWPSATAP